MDRQQSDMVRVGGALLGDSFRAMHSTVRSDRSVLALRSGGWPQFLREDAVPDEVRETFTPREVARATEVCEVYAAMTRVPLDQRKLALLKAMSPEMSWRTVADVSGHHWTYCRRTYESVVSDFVKAVARSRGLSVEDLVGGDARV